MRRASAGRATRLGACVLTACGLACLGFSAPAFADNDQLSIHFTPYHLVLPTATGGGAAPERTASVGLYHDNTGTLPGGEIDVDARSLAGTATVTWPDNCTVTGGLQAVCSVPSIPDIGHVTDQVFLTVRATDTATVGATGTILYTGHNDSYTANDESLEVIVASGPDLTLGAMAPIGHAVPGSRHDVALQLENKGNEPASGAILRISSSHGLAFTRHYSNCVYSEIPSDGHYPATPRATCTFDQTLDPNTVYTTADPLTLDVTSYAVHERLDMTIEPKSTAALADARRGMSPAEDGAGPLRLEKVRQAGPLAAGDDIDEDNNYTLLAVNADNTADFAVTGARVQGKAGDSVTASVGLVNHGPGWIANLGSGDPVAVVDFRVPEGTTATGIPAACRPRGLNDEYIAKREGAPRYLCSTTFWLDKDATVGFPFTLHVDRVVPGATGSVSFLTTGFLGQPLPFDPTTSDNATAVVVNAAAPAPSADFNGDGYGDIAVSAPTAAVGSADKAGAVVVHYGSSTGISAARSAVVTQNSTGVPGTSEAGDQFGRGSASGDFNGDGFTDLAVSAPHEKVGTDTDGGTVAILWGSATGLHGGTTVADPAPSAHDLYGVALAAADFDGDGKTDLAVGSSGKTVYIHRGGFTTAGGTGGTDTYGAPIQAGTWAGVLNLNAGDVNGDHIADLIVGGYNTDEVGFDINIVAYGSRTGGLPSTGGHLLPGGFVAAVGDLNGDHYGDIVIGMEFDPGTGGTPTLPGSVKGGKVLVVNGSASGVGGSAAYSITQDTAGVPGTSETGDRFGSEISLGDVNGDGHPDLAVGAWAEAVGTVRRTGSVTVLYGTTAGLTGTGSQVFHQDTPSVPGTNETDDHFGSDMKLTDVNGDGKADLTVGVNGENDFNGALVALRSDGAKITATGSIGISATAAGLSTAGRPQYGINFAD